jgi:hypothetical protein
MNVPCTGDRRSTYGCVVYCHGRRYNPAYMIYPNPDYPFPFHLSLI